MRRPTEGLQKKLIRVGPLELLYVVTIAAVARVVALFLLPNSPSSFGPDEGTYAFLAEWVEEGEPVSDFPAYGAGLYNSARSLILPSVMFIRLGFEPLNSVRVTSLVYGILSIYLFGKLILDMSGKLLEPRDVSKKKLSLIFFSFFAFLPSPFIWSVLGLRESASVFWIMLSTYLLVTLKEPRKRLSDSLTSYSFSYKPLLALISIVFAFGARKETALVFLTFFCLTLLLFIGRHRLLIGSICLLGTIGGHLFTATPGTETNTTPGTETNGSQVSSSNMLRSSLSQSPLRVLTILEDKRNQNAIDANTALPITECSAVGSPILSQIQCNLKEFPYRLVSTLVRPFVYVDTGSTANNLASIENIVWLLLFSIFTLGSISLIRNRVLIQIVVPLVAYVFSFASLMALYEGNLGTAFRHKSTLLWPILLVIFIFAIANPKTKLLRVER